MAAKKKAYWIDFESWQVEANNRSDAYRLVFERLMKGEFPEILSLETAHKPSLKAFEEFMNKNKVN